MEFCPHGDLFSIIVKLKSVPEEPAKVMLKQVLLALQYLHDHDIGHRDIKPENIMLDEKEHAKLTDFGLAKRAPVDELTSTPCGSPYYVCPEILHQIPYSPKQADMWSFGVVLYATVSGQVPWTSVNRQQVLEQIKTGEFSIPATMSSLCANLVKGLLTVKPEKRLTVSEALNHKWFRDVEVEMPPTESIPYVSIRKVDDFFSMDEERDKSIGLLNRCASTSMIETSYNKVLTSITAVITRPVQMKPVQTSVSMWGKWAVDEPEIEDVRAPTLQSLIGPCRIQKKRGPKIIRPKVEVKHLV